MSEMSQIRELHFLDDSSDELMITEMMLRRDRIGLDLFGYSEFEDFMARAETQSSDQTGTWLVAFDLNLGPVSGIDYIRKIRRQKKFDGMIVGICSGSQDPKDRQDAMDAGASFFVTKPMRGIAVREVCAALPGVTVVEGDATRPVEILRAV